MRFCAVKFSGWSISAAGYQPENPVAVLDGGFIRLCSAAAYADGVRIGQRRREAKKHCPEIDILAPDPYRDAQAFEPFIKVLTAVVPRLEVTRPGMITLAADGPSRYYGSEERLRDSLKEAVKQATNQPPEVRVGIAESRFGAALAARVDQIVAPGRTREFLEPFSIATLELDELTVLSRRLGIYTLGQFAALPARSVLTRFGSAAATAHIHARGLNVQPLVIYELPEPLMTMSTLDPAAERVDIATFAARPLAAELTDLLTRRGLACTQLRIDAETEHAELMSRSWRGSPVFDAETIVERVRWQLAGWLTASVLEQRPTAGISVLRLHAEEVAKSADLQVSLWGEMSETDRRAVRGLDRVRGLLGPKGVFTAVLRGGRGPADRAQWIPWGEPVPSAEIEAPWPGHLPAPSPSLLYPDPIPVKVHGSKGPVGVTIRGEITDRPASIRLPGSGWRQISAWSGPWLTDEHWWDPQTHTRQARFQILTDEPVTAHLCLVRQNAWYLEATYD